MTMDTYTEALAYMQRDIACPDDVKACIAGLRVTAQEGRMNTNWRSGSRAVRPPQYPVSRGAVPRFGNRGRTDISVEERMMDRIRDKMNKFSPLTYDSIKGWLCQLLDSGEKDFLSDFIALVFEKAASETTFCALYARLITELREGFPYLHTELERIFHDYLGIFAEVRDTPDVSSTEYKKFLKLRDQR